MPTPRKPEFSATRWSLILDARGGDDAVALQALEELCQRYWYPLYAYVRRQGRDPEESADLTQSFFEKLIEKEWLRAVSPEKGRFRTFLLTALGHFLSNDWNRSRRIKRGGGRTPLALDALEAEERYRLEPAETVTPETLYERRWAMTVLEAAFLALEAECGASGKRALFEALRPHLSGDPDAAMFADLAPPLGMTEGSLKVAAHRMRRRYGELVRAEIGRTVDDRPEAIDAELGHLQEVLRG